MPRLAAFRPRSRTAGMLLLLLGAAVWLWASLRIGLLEATPGARSSLLLVYSIPVLIPVAMVLSELHRQFSFRSSLGRGLALMALGGASWALGNAVWFYYQQCSSLPVLACGDSIRVPFPSLADLLYLGIYPLCTAGGVFVARALGMRLRHAVRPLVALVPLSVLTLVVGLPHGALFGLPVGLGLLAAQDATAGQLLLTSAYALGDVCLLVMSIVLLGCARRVAGGSFVLPLCGLIGAMALLLVADVAFFSSLARDAYDELGLPTPLYAATLTCLPWAIHRFTRADRSERATGSRLPSDPWHDAAWHIVEEQARLFGGVASELAGETPGVRMSAGMPLLEAPYDQSLRNLATTFSGRLGPCGDRMLRLALRRSSEHHPRGVELRPLLGDLEALRHLGAGPAWGERPWIAPLMGSTTVGVVAGIAAMLASHGHGIDYGVAVAAPPMFAALVFGHFAVRARMRGNHRRQQLQAANDSLGSLLEAFDRARVDERSRMAGEVHDFALQQLIGSLMHLERAQARSLRGDARAGESIGRATELVSGSIAGLRRIMDGLQPSSLLHQDVGAALAELAAQIGSTYGVSVEVDAPALAELPLEQQLLVYRTVAELLSNAGKHSAASELRVTARRVGDGLRICAQDDGIGFPHAVDLVNELPAEHGWGLRLMLEQVSRQNGFMHLQSAPGAGTTVVVVLPTPCDLRAAS